MSQRIMSPSDYVTAGLCPDRKRNRIFTKGLRTLTQVSSEEISTQVFSSVLFSFQPEHRKRGFWKKCSGEGRRRREGEVGKELEKGRKHGSVGVAACNTASCISSINSLFRCMQLTEDTSCKSRKPAQINNLQSCNLNAAVASVPPHVVFQGSHFLERTSGRVKIGSFILGFGEEGVTFSTNLFMKKKYLKNNYWVTG